MNIVCDPTKHDDLFPKWVKLQSWLSAKWNFAECQERLDCRGFAESRAYRAYQGLFLSAITK